MSACNVPAGIVAFHAMNTCEVCREAVDDSERVCSQCRQPLCRACWAVDEFCVPCAASVYVDPPVHDRAPAQARAGQEGQRG